MLQQHVVLSCEKTLMPENISSSRRAIFHTGLNKDATGQNIIFLFSLCDLWNSRKGTNLRTRGVLIYKLNFPFIWSGLYLVVRHDSLRLFSGYLAVVCFGLFLKERELFALHTLFVAKVSIPLQMQVARLIVCHNVSWEIRNFYFISEDRVIFDALVAFSTRISTC